MARYKIGKLQVKRLIENKAVVDGQGRKFLANKEVKDYLTKFDELNLYDKYDIYIDNGGVDIVHKECLVGVV